MTYENLITIKILSNSLNQWIISLAVFIITNISAYLLYFIIIKLLNKLSKNKENELENFIIDIIKYIKNFIIIILGIYLSIQFLNINKSLYSLINKILIILITIKITLFIQKFLLKKFEKIIIKSLDYRLKRKLQPILRKILLTTIWLITFFLIITNLGYNLTSLIAGLGIGGIFIALAAQETLSNFFSSLSLFLDEPFAIGDIVDINGIIGTVEEFGLRSSRIRTFEGTLVAIPNNEIAKQKIINISKRENRRIDLNINLEYSTSTLKLKKALNIIKKALKSNKNICENFRVHFINFADSALLIEVVYYVKLLETFDEVQDTRQDVNFKIKIAFEKEEINFAFPSQSIYLKNN
jgi:MscS family membrane protein